MSCGLRNCENCDGKRLWDLWWEMWMVVIVNGKGWLVGIVVLCDRESWAGRIVSSVATYIVKWEMKWEKVKICEEMWGWVIQCCCENDCGKLNMIDSLLNDWFVNYFDWVKACLTLKGKWSWLYICMKYVMFMCVE